MKDSKLAKFAERIKAKIYNMMKTPLNEEPFGFRSLERLDIGDLVTWSELSVTGREKDQKIGNLEATVHRQCRERQGLLDELKHYRRNN